MRDWQKYASDRLGRNVERTPDGRGIRITEDELKIITRSSWPVLILTMICGFALAALFIWLTTD